MKLRVLLLICDSKPDSGGNIHPPGSATLPKDPVPVTLEFRRDLMSMVGRATLAQTPDGGMVYADLELLDTRISPEMMKILYPAAGGRSLEVVDEKVFKKIELTDVGLSITKNSDERILTLAGQLELTRS